LEACASCRAEREAERRLESVLAPIKSTPGSAAISEPPARFTDRVENAFRPRHWSAAALVACAAVGAAAIALLLASPSQRHPSGIRQFVERPQPQIAVPQAFGEKPLPHRAAPQGHSASGTSQGPSIRV